MSAPSVTYRPYTPSKAGKPRWRIFIDSGFAVVGGERKRRVSTEVFEGSERAVEKRVRAIIQQHSRVAPDRMTLGEWLEQWLEDFTGHTSPQTRRGYRMIVTNHLQPHLGMIRLQELSPLDVKHFYTLQEKRGLSACTINHHHRVLFAALEVAEEAELIDRNPMRKRKVVRPPVVRSEEKYVIADQAERRRLVQVARGWRDRHKGDEGKRGRPAAPFDLEIPVLLALQMGLRRGEVCALRWCDIDFEHGVLRVERAYDTAAKGDPFKSTKSGKRVVAKMPQGVVDALAEHRLRQGAERLEQGVPRSEQDTVCAHYDGRPYHPDRLSVEFRELVDAHGFDKRLTFHGLRHTCATVMDSGGTSRKVIQGRIGHSTAQMTEHYTHVLSKDDELAAELLNEDLFGPSPQEATG